MRRGEERSPELHHHRASSPLNLSMKHETLVKSEVKDDPSSDCTPSPPLPPTLSSLPSPHSSPLGGFPIPTSLHLPTSTWQNRLESSGRRSATSIWSPAVTCEQETTKKKNLNNNNNVVDVHAGCGGDCGDVTGKFSPDMAARCTSCHLSSSLHRTERAFAVSQFSKNIYVYQSNF